MKLEQVKKAIELLEMTNPNDPKAYANTIKIFNSIGELPTIIVITDTEKKLYRTRTHYDDILFTEIKKISTPDKIYVKSFGRCNIPNSPIFYSSEDRKTSYAELVEGWIEQQNEHNKIYATIGLWLTKRPMKLIIVSSPDASDRKTGYDRYFGGILDNCIDKIHSKDQTAYIEYHIYLFNKFRQKSKNDNKSYIITSAYTNLALYVAGKKADGILYPSVPRDGEGFNFALKPSFIKSSNIELKAVFRDAFVRIDNPTGLPTFQQIENQIESKNINVANGTIIW